MDKAAFRKAIEDSEEPTPGYILREISQSTYADYAAQEQLLRALFDPLQETAAALGSSMPSTHHATASSSSASSATPVKSVFVVYKLLHLIRTLCESGHPNVQQEVQHGSRVEVLKAFAGYRGLPDLRHGDAWNAKVRQEAAATLDAAFRVRNDERDARKWEGFGNTVGTESTTTTSHTPSFTTGLRVRRPGYGVAGSSGTSALPSRGGEEEEASRYTGDPSPSPSQHIAEMPRENKWAEYVASLAATAHTHGKRGSALSAGGRTYSAGHGGSSLVTSTSVLDQLTEKAKAGFALLRSYEALHTLNDPVKAGAKVRTVPVHAFTDDTEKALACGFQPIALPDVVATTSSSEGRGGGQVGDTHHQESAPRWRFLDEMEATGGGGEGAREPCGDQPTQPPSLASAHADPMSGAGRGFSSTTQREASDTVTVSCYSPSPPRPTAASANPFGAAVTRVVSGRAAPTRAELARFVQDCLEQANRRLTSAADSFPPSSPWNDLGDALNEQLTAKQPWQRRLHTLLCIEALLRSPSAKDGTTRFFTAHPLYLQRNASSVVQATLKDRAEKVLQLLGLPLALEGSVPQPDGAQSLSDVLPSRTAQNAQAARDAPLAPSAQVRHEQERSGLSAGASDDPLASLFGAPPSQATRTTVQSDSVLAGLTSNALWAPSGAGVSALSSPPETTQAAQSEAESAASPLDLTGLHVRRPQREALDLEFSGSSGSLFTQAAPSPSANHGEHTRLSGGASPLASVTAPQEEEDAGSATASTRLRRRVPIRLSDDAPGMTMDLNTMGSTSSFFSSRVDSGHGSHGLNTATSQPAAPYPPASTTVSVSHTSVGPLDALFAGASDETAQLAAQRPSPPASRANSAIRVTGFTVAPQNCTAGSPSTTAASHDPLYGLFSAPEADPATSVFAPAAEGKPQRGNLEVSPSKGSSSCVPAHRAIAPDELFGTVPVMPPRPPSGLDELNPSFIPLQPEVNALPTSGGGGSSEMAVHRMQQTFAQLLAQVQQSPSADGLARLEQLLAVQQQWIEQLQHTHGEGYLDGSPSQGDRERGEGSASPAYAVAQPSTTQAAHSHVVIGGAVRHDATATARADVRRQFAEAQAEMLAKMSESPLL